MDNVNPKHSRRWWVAIKGLLIVAGMLIIALLFVPTMDVNKRQRANQAMAVGKLETITKLQRSFALNHPTTGYSCDLAKLRSSAKPAEGFDPEAFLEPGEHRGYRFVLGCEAEQNGAVLHYRVIAVPTKLEDAGFKYSAFCSDDSGVIRYDRDASGENGLTKGQAIN
jgi:hypothetical protein